MRVTALHFWVQWCSGSTSWQLAVSIRHMTGRESNCVRAVSVCVPY